MSGWHRYRQLSPRNVSSRSSWMLLGVGSVAACLLGFQFGLVSEENWAQVSEWTIGRPDCVTDLLDTSIVLSTPGASLVDQLHDAFVPIEMDVPDIVDNYFNITIQCDSSIIGNPTLCPPAYLVHFRGPLAHSVPPVPSIYHHDEKTGRTIVECHLPLAGKYEVWVWPDRAEKGDCPANPKEGPLGAVKGSGRSSVLVEKGVEVDNMRACTVDDYQGEIKGRWVSVGHIRKKYHRSLRSHLLKSPHTNMPDYIYLPYQCKRDVLDFTQSLKSISDLTHVAYLGDSILRTTFCNHLYPALHNGEISGDCAYSGDIQGYHMSPKSFEIEDKRFSLRFIANKPWEMQRPFSTLKEADQPVSHVIMNIGMWFGASSEVDYINAATLILDTVYSLFGDAPRYTWIETYSLSPAALCYESMRRTIMRHHGEWATVALNNWRDRHPSLRVNQIKSFPIIDSRPETTSDGRHWVSEGGIPSLDSRPLVGAADDAVMEAVYDYWRLASEASHQ